MSNWLGVAAVTEALRGLLDAYAGSEDVDLAGLSTTARPPDKARTGTGNQLNLFLFQASESPAWRNRPANGHTGSNGAGPPALGLDLQYLLTAYGRDDDEGLAQRVLARAMLFFHDHPVLAPDQLRTALPGTDVHLQVERVRLTPRSLSVDELSRLWATFQTPYRLSAAYQASIVLLESTRPHVHPLPVLRIGTADRGPTVAPSLVPPYPTLTRVAVPQGFTARLGDVVALEGHHLIGVSTAVVFRHPRFVGPVTVAPDGGSTPTRVLATIPNDPVHWPAGVWTVSVEVTAAGSPAHTVTTGECPFRLSPTITALPLTATVDTSTSPPAATVPVACQPDVWPDQQAALIVGDHAVPAEPRTGPTGTLTFVLAPAMAGTYLVRLRVDGVDSHLVDTASVPPTFDPDQKLVLT